MKNFFKKFNWKGLLAAILAIGVLLGVVAGISAIFNNDTKTISSGEFACGDLDLNGDYVSSDKAIYTKDAFKCLGLSVEQNFESGATYDVYYYDNDGDFVESRIGLRGKYDEDFPLATYARIVIHPEIPEDIDSDDFKIRFWEVRSYANELKITVNKDQTDKYETTNLMSLATQSTHTCFTYLANGDSINQGATSNTLDLILFTPEYKNFDIFVKVHEESDVILAAVGVDEDSVIHAKAEMSLADVDADTWVKLELGIKNLDNVCNVFVNVPTGAEVYIYGYNK